MEKLKSQKSEMTGSVWHSDTEATLGLSLQPNVLSALYASPLKHSSLPLEYFPSFKICLLQMTTLILYHP